MRICMLLHKSVVFDSRVRREAKALAAAGHEVTVVQLAPAEVPSAVTAEGYRVVSALPRDPGGRRLPFALHRLAFMRRFVAAIRALRPDVVHAHDAAMLAPGFVGTRLVGCRLVYDAHELATGVPYRGPGWAAFVWVLERLLIRRCDAVITVSDGIAERLREMYRLPERPVVVRNLPDLPPARDRAGLRKRLGVGDAPLVLHQGAAASGRGCEQLVSALRHLPEVHVLFLGDGDPGYNEWLSRRAGENGVQARVHFHDSVPLERLLAYTAEADVGVSLLDGDCENHRLALPNKVFEYVAAGVPVLASALPELDRVVREHGIGWTVDSSDPADIARGLAQALRSLADPGLGSNLARAARRLSWEEERGVLERAYARIANGAEGSR